MKRSRKINKRQWIAIIILVILILINILFFAISGELAHMTAQA